MFIRRQHNWNDRLTQFLHLTTFCPFLFAQHVIFGMSKDFCASGLRVGVLHTRNAAILQARQKLVHIKLFSCSWLLLLKEGECHCHLFCAPDLMTCSLIADHSALHKYISYHPLPKSQPSQAPPKRGIVAPFLNCTSEVTHHWFLYIIVTLLHKN